jgi:transcriptional regulator of heat shock response
MDQRIEQVLTCAIEDFIQTAEPISSQSLTKGHGLDVSSATIRNWFAQLEEEGYLVQPHTSAGRIPTEAGYRWFVSRLGDVECDEDCRDAMKRAIGEDRDFKQAAKTCAELTGLAVFLGSGTSDTYYTGLSQLFSQPEFRDWSRVISMSSILDRLDHQLNQLRSKQYDVPTILIGDACPFGNASSSIMLTLPNATLLGVLGPLRMDYRKTRNIMSLIQTCL